MNQKQRHKQKISKGDTLRLPGREFPARLQNRSALLDQDKYRDLDTRFIYGDLHRDVFLNEIRRSFIQSASKEELKVLHAALKHRAKLLKAGERGGQRNADRRDWIQAARTAAWRHYVEGWTWHQILSARGQKPTKAHLGTLARQVDQYAKMIWRVCIEIGAGQPSLQPEQVLERIKTKLGSLAVRRLFWIRVGLWFDYFLEKNLTRECSKIVLALALKGERVSNSDFVALLTSKPQNGRP